MKAYILFYHKIKKLFFSFLLSSLFISMLTIPAEASTVTYGTCGDNLTWTFDNEGILVISGTGEMNNYSWQDSPWYSEKESITSVVISNGVTSIGDWAFCSCSTLTSITIPNSVNSIGVAAFFECSNLTSIIIPNSVNSIGSGAFISCSSLTSITIPNNITSIGEESFLGCSSLTSFTIPNSVTSIGEAAFSDCLSLTSIIIPRNVTSIGNYAFAGCSSLTSITVSVGNNNYCSVDGVLFNRSKTLLITYPAGKTGSTYRIPDGIIVIGEGAFMYCSGLNSVVIPNGVNSIGKQAFCDCSNLTSITIPNSITNIGKSAFFACDNLKTVQYLGTTEQWSSIIVGSSNENLLCAANNSGNTYIVQRGFCGDNLTWMLDNVETLTISGTGSMYDYGHISDLPWYSQKSIIKSVIIKNGVTNIGEGAFYECSNLTSVTIPDSVTSIGIGAFMECSNLTSVTIPNNVARIGMGAFIMCENLTSITIPYSVTSIGEAAFFGCSCLSRVYFTGSLVQWHDIEIEADNNELSSAYISFAVKFVDNEIASGTSASKSFTWILNENGQLTIIGSGDMADCFNPGEAYISEIKELFIQEGITRIPNYAFLDIINVKNVTIPNSVTSIGMGAFSGCNSLEKIMIPESVSDIGDYPFSTNVKIYCYEYSYAYFWAEDNGFTAVLLDDGNMNNLVTVTLPETKTIMAGSACYIGGTIFPVSDEVSISWTSSAPDVAEVSTDGILTAWKAGTTIVTMSAGEKTVQCLVTVVQGAESFDIESDIYVATTKTIPVSLFNITPSDATLDLTWTTDNTVYATVSPAGLVTGKAVGETQLTVTDSISGLSRTATIHICYPVQSISLALAENPVYAGFPATVAALVTTTKGQSYVNKLVSFSSSDTNIAAVDQQGNIQTFEPGAVTITATAANGVTASCSLTVQAIQHVLTLPASLTEIGNEAFAGLTAVEAVRIPSNVNDIADDAFAGSDVIILAPAGSYAERWAWEHGMTVIVE